MKATFVIGGIILLAIIAIATNQSSEPAALTASQDIGAEETLSSDIEPAVTQSNPETEAVSTPAEPASGTYQTYSTEALAASSAKHNILIFSATWCPSCRALDKDIKDNVGNIPGDTALFTVDYDSNVALRQKYGVTTQHTLVLVETDGTSIKSWRGGNTLTSVLTNI
jgi:thioredoxin 1